MKPVFTLLLLSISTLWVQAQVGGMGTYRFLYLQPSARIAALGGNAIATPDHDVNLTVQNPSLLNKDFHNQVGLNFVNYFADIKAGDFNYSYHADTIHTTFSLGMQFVNYGNFTKTDIDGTVLGSFSAGEYNLHFSATRTYKQFQYGASLKIINSTLESYNSYGIAADVAGSWFSKDRLMMLTTVVSNLGTQLKAYRNDNYENIPYNIQLGFSKKFEHNPLRIGIIAHNLQSMGKLLYQIDDRNRKEINFETGLPNEEKFSIFDHALSHLIVNTELIFGKTLNIRFGYNDLRRREMSLRDVRGMNGFSWGFGVRIYRIQVSYGSGIFMTGRNTNNFSIVTRLDDFKRKKSTTN
ncbi:MAG: type IX secretion system protein PorQ [Bacteroidota bacterium]|nr:type IX secretion system protein PorQ [Bacteroidota bacterium]